MSLYKRRKTWHTDFSVNGQRFRQSLDTSDWREAQAKEKELIAQASAGRLAASNQQFSRLRLSDVLDRHLADRSVHVLPRGHRSESDHAKPLRQHLGTIPLWLLFESGLRSDPIIRILKEIAGTKQPKANLAAKKLLESQAEYLLYRSGAAWADKNSPGKT